MRLGEFNELEILRDTSVGLYLGDEEGNDVLLPNKYVPETFEIGDKLNVFIYLDSEDRPVATDIVPKIQLHSFAYLNVKMVNSVGAFLDWGLEKDLFVPFREQMVNMQEGRNYMVYLFIDEKTDRLIASAKLEKFLDNENITVEEKEEVQIQVWKQTDLGYNVIINNKHKGLIYNNEVFAPLANGYIRKAYIEKIREDGKIDVRLEKSGVEGIEPNAMKILKELSRNNHFLALNDKSSPEEITAVLHMSKKVFKKAVGSLYKQRIITIEDDGIRLVD